MGISVVLPMRNAAPWLPALLAALVREWATGFELIAIDDGSSDGSPELLQQLCRHWPRQRWRLLPNAGQGVSAARNLGVAASRQPLVAFLDADDRPLPGRLALSLQHLETFVGSVGRVARVIFESWDVAQRIPLNLPETNSSSMTGLIANVCGSS